MEIPTIYLVIGFRTVEDTANGGYAVITDTPIQRSTREGADESYYTKLAAAARNTTYPSMGAVMMTNEGFVLEHKCYTLRTEAE